MALGRHWEWRGFGKVSSSLRDRWSALDDAPSDRVWHDVVDRYLWVPGYGLNAKLRSGLSSGDCLKFKRLKARWKQLQLWDEDANDIYGFPLKWSEMQSLAKELQIDLPEEQSDSVGFDQALDIFKKSKPPAQIIEVHKHRQARLWRSGSAKVLIELAEITEPEKISSLCFESTLELTSWSGPERMTAARESVRQAVDDLAVHTERLLTMNYVDTLTIWANGHRLSDTL